ncbi:DUF748 domain-containing protein [Paraburkholderia sp.]|uniref:DUF748 domain-containing protein n=1 Tax=Paraburkholderia sp. TaxID=1926495 RepID=UPI0023A54E0B|nr:DUF748 domain-containing protein [Paraburkholderia sp.]MDE1180610.1 DUF748 domain-containing protein [Paraburkholderia sp.]
MAMSLGKRVSIAIVGVIVTLAVIAFIGLQYAQREIRSRLIDALGPLGSAETIDVGLTSIRLTHVRLKPPPGWIGSDPLRADEIIITPDVRDMIARRIHIRDVTVRGFDMAVVRSADGTIRILPNLRQSIAGQRAAASGTDADADEAKREKLIDHISLENGNFEFYDLTVSNPAYRIVISSANATVDHLHLPALDEPTTLSVTGAIKGPQHTGTVAFGGWIRVSNKDSQTTCTLRGVDIETIDPYLLKKAGAKAQITGGTIDLSVQSTVKNYQLHAPGTLTLHHLQLADSGNPLDTFMSIPTRAAIAAMKSHGDDITLHFVLDGNLRDPKFSVRDSLMTRIGAGLANALGVSAEGVAKGANETVKGIGNALKNLLGQ